MKVKCIQVKPTPPKEGMKQSYSLTVEWMEGEVKKMVEGLSFDALEAGKEYDVTLEERIGKTSGKPWTSIRLARANKPRYEKDWISTIISTGTSYATDLYLMEPFREGKFGDIVKEVVAPMLGLITPVSTSREKEFISFAMSYAIRVYRDEYHGKRFREAKKFDGKDVAQELSLVKDLFHVIYKAMFDIHKTT